jgi:hypothetical protein
MVYGQRELIEWSDIDRITLIMLILRCTRKLRMKNLGPVGRCQDSLVPTLGTWHANLIYLARKPIVLCVNDLSLLSVLAPGRKFGNILPVIQARILERFTRMGLSAEVLLQEQDAMAVTEVQQSNSKSVLGSMNDFTRGLKWEVRDRLDVEALNELEDRLSHTPMGALNYQYAIEVAYQLFGVPEEESRKTGPAIKPLEAFTLE